MIDRNRMSERVSPSVLLLELKRSIGPLLMLAVGLIVAVLAASYILSNINGGISGTRILRFQVSDVTGVVPGRAESDFEGIEAGLITQANVINGHAVLTVTVAKKFGPIYRNARAELRPNTALQDMYFDIVSRGTKAAGVAPPGYVVPMGQTQSPVNLADVLNLFQPGVRASLYDLVDQLGNGLQNRGEDLKEAFIDLAPFLSIAGKVSHQLAVRSSLTKDLVHNAAIFASVLASRNTQLRQLVTSGSRSLDALSTEGGVPLSDTIKELPPTFAALEPTLGDINRLVPNLDTAITNLGPVANELPAGLSSLQALAKSAEPAVEKLQTPVVKLLPLADQLRPFASSLLASLTNLAPQIGDINTLTTDGAECTHQLNEFFNWDASMTKLADADATTARGNANFGFYADPALKVSNLTSPKQCAGGSPITGIPTPKYDGPAPAK